MIITQGNLVMLGLNTDAPQVYFNGNQVTDVTEIKIDWEHDEQRVKLKVNGTQDELYMQLVEAGVTVKKEKRHV
jgi:hypothetical protein